MIKIIGQDDLLLDFSQNILCFMCHVFKVAKGSCMLTERYSLESW